MPLTSRVKSLLQDLDAKVEEKLGGSQQRQYPQYPSQYHGQYGGHQGGGYGWQQHQNNLGEPSSQWQQLPPQGQSLGIPQPHGRPRGNSSPGERDWDSNGLPLDNPPSYNEVSASQKKESHPTVDEWAPNNPFRDHVSSTQGGIPSQASQPQQMSTYQHQQRFPPPSQQPQAHPSGPQPMFPPRFEMWFNTQWSSDKTELHIAGQRPQYPAYVATFSLGFKGKTELHAGSAQGPILMSAKSTSISGTKQGMVFPDGSTVELSTPDLRKYYFTMPIGPNGYPEKFKWKKAQGGDMKGISPIYTGWKLTRESTGEVLAVFGENVGFKQGAGDGVFEFVGAARAGVLGAHWQNVAAFSFVKVVHEKFVASITGAVADAAG